jgi:hypothetical protein
MKIRSVALALLVVCSGVVVSGCRSANKPASGSFASVDIPRGTAIQIAEAMSEVFESKGWRSPSKTGPDRLTYEREGSVKNNMAYGNWLSGGNVWMRVRASIVSLQETSYRLQCNLYAVRDRGATTEEEIKVSSVYSGTYQKMLEEVARRVAAVNAPLPQK